MPNLAIPDLLDFLKNKDYDAQIQKETDQIYIILKISEREFPLFIRIMGEGGLVQLMVFFPCNIKAEAVSDLARLLHTLNKELDIPGFGMDEKAGVAFYRCMIPTIDNQFNESVLEGFLNSVKIVCETFSPAVEAVAFGATTFDELLKKAEEQAQKQSQPS